ncbi:MAG: hypothetical protein A2X28_11050 [Elusimicrobia bacterium GWA2_56_46]|nr:MAG: hypothetical protein A2X28_11050 [Elusimicrobia bacterium GWA2_56_46]OGR54136.1 MAG: hypothetical protein A2X39_05425 [Elusimicrobia bacterium GWC2_56_31]
MFYKLKVHAGAKRDKLLRKGPDSFELWIKAPAERGLANAAAVRLLAAEIKIEPKRILLIKGAQSPAKIVKVI